MDGPNPMGDIHQSSSHSPVGGSRAVAHLSLQTPDRSSKKTRNG